MKERGEGSGTVTVTKKIQDLFCHSVRAVHSLWSSGIFDLSSGSCFVFFKSIFHQTVSSSDNIIIKKTSLPAKLWDTFFCYTVAQRSRLLQGPGNSTSPLVRCTPVRSPGAGVHSLGSEKLMIYFIFFINENGCWGFFFK